MTRERHDEIIKRIQAGETELVEKQSRTRSLHRLDGMLVVYDKGNKTLVTVLYDEEG